MIDKKTLRSQLDSMEQTAESVLRESPAFCNALQGLKNEIDEDPDVQAVKDELLAAGRSVSNCFAPRVRISISSEQQVLEAGQAAESSSADPIRQLTEELTEAASAVIQNSPYCEALETIVNEAVSANDRFDEIAAEVENAGHQLLICLDLAVFTEVKNSAERPPAKQNEQPGKPFKVVRSPRLQLTEADLTFLKALKIKLDEE